MAAVGMSRAVIDRVSKSLDALDMVRQGRSDDLPDDVKNELAGQADAELSGAEQLAAIVDQRRKGSPRLPAWRAVNRRRSSGA